jgi:hypothetical protein
MEVQTTDNKNQNRNKDDKILAASKKKYPKPDPVPGPVQTYAMYDIIKSGKIIILSPFPAKRTETKRSGFPKVIGSYKATKPRAKPTSV